MSSPCRGGQSFCTINAPAGSDRGIPQETDDLLFGESLLDVQSPDYVIGLQIAGLLK
jgi:hypothetical protein